MTDLRPQEETTVTPRRRGPHRLRVAMAVGTVAGLAILVTLIVNNGLPEIAHILESAGWALLWVIPARIPSLALDATAWRTLLHGESRSTVPFLTWLAAVRDSVNNLLPVARVGGEVVGVRLLMMRGISGPAAAASVMVEISLTLAVQFAFTLLGLVFLLYYVHDNVAARVVIIGLLVSVPLVVGFVLLQHHWGMFQLLERGLTAVMGRKVLSLAGDPRLLDQAIQELYRRRKTIIVAAWWQFAGMLAGAIELWFTLWLLGHPIDPRAAIMMESLTLATQSASFLVPGGLGIQEGSFVLFGAATGLTPDVSLALSLARRVRQLGTGLPALLSWQWVEGRQLRRLLRQK